ncbi:hypothetical protein QJS10_CPB17g01803 [Acorus calamus]|uniref:RING-type domain-containing protein n=1 Tax=Acorus calamus TaxID=4465 RepID=A0AAV9CQ19_ACOCL|nr:hypothetical protein QJS10_CPB17g01803 [Acorus calamus]
MSSSIASSSLDVPMEEVQAAAEDCKGGDLVDLLFEQVTLEDQMDEIDTSVADASVVSCGSDGGGRGDGHVTCAICLEGIVLEETALVKGCEHAYCVTCILRWATYNQKPSSSPSCPQCKHPFEFLNIHRSLDGCIHDYMFEESVCLLLRAPWFVPLSVEPHDEPYDELEDIIQFQYQQYEHELDEDDDLEEAYYASSSNLRIGNRRWGDNGYIRSGRSEARPVGRDLSQGTESVGPSRGPKKKEVAKEMTGRRAKRALKREAADKAAAAKHLVHLQRLGRK